MQCPSRRKDSSQRRPCLKRKATTPLAYTGPAEAVPVTVVETPEFIRRRRGLLSDEERWDLIKSLALNPEQGDIMPGTSGVRKVRLEIQGRGKSGGARVIYYYHNRSIPIFMLTMFPKNVKIDLSQAEKNEMRCLIPALIDTYRLRSAR